MHSRHFGFFRRKEPGELNGGSCSCLIKCLKNNEPAQMITLNSLSSVQKLLLTLRVSSYDIGKCLRCNQSMVTLVWQAMVSIPDTQKTVCPAGSQVELLYRRSKTLHTPKLDSCKGATKVWPSVEAF